MDTNNDFTRMVANIGVTLAFTCPPAGGLAVKHLHVALPYKPPPPGFRMKKKEFIFTFPVQGRPVYKSMAGYDEAF
jgi:hypothetical protein